MPKPEEIFKAEGTILSGTGKAVLFSINDEDVWIPLSQLHDPHELYEADEFGEPDGSKLRRGANVEIKMTAWIAKKVGLL